VFDLDLPLILRQATDLEGKMPKTTLNIQDSFLNQARRDRTSVTVRVMGGSDIDGKITAFDNFTVIVTNEELNQQYLIYKHAIATITPKGKVRWSSTTREDQPHPQRTS
jgi:host factor-I protein